MDAFPTSGIVKILNHGLDPFPVYCYQTNDEGGDYCYNLLIVDVSCFIVVVFSLVQVEKNGEGLKFLSILDWCDLNLLRQTPVLSLF